MTKREKTVQIIMEYELLHDEYEWYLTHKYVLEACRQNDFSVLGGCSQKQIDNIHHIFNTWIKATELADRLSTGLRYNRVTRGY